MAHLIHAIRDDAPNLLLLLIFSGGLLGGGWKAIATTWTWVGVILLVVGAICLLALLSKIASDYRWQRSQQR